MLEHLREQARKRLNRAQRVYHTLMHSPVFRNLWAAASPEEKNALVRSDLTEEALRVWMTEVTKANLELMQYKDIKLLAQQMSIPRYSSLKVETLRSIIKAELK